MVTWTVAYVCYVILAILFIWEETYISNITSFPALSVFMFIYVRILLLLFVCLNAE